MFKFTVKRNEDESLSIFDISRSVDRFPTKIDSFLITVISPKLPLGIISDLDALSYMQLNRVNNELYKLTPEVLGFDSNQAIPDGSYNVEIRINNTELYKLSFVVTSDIASKIAILMDKVDVTIDIEDNSLFDDNLPFDDYHSRVYYTIAVYFKLVVLIGTEGNLIEVNDLIDKLQRLLSVIT